MTKRILALLLAVLFAVSCCMMTACGGNSDEGGTTNDDGGTTNDGGNDKEPADDKTSDAPADDDKTSEPATSDDAGTSDEPADEPVADEPAAEFPGEELPIDFYSAANFETWTGKGTVIQDSYCWWHAVVQIDEADTDVDLKTGLGTADYPYTWTLNARLADSSDTWVSVPTQLDTMSGMGESTVIFRLQVGTGLEQLCKVGEEYEMVVTIEGPDGAQYRSGTLYTTWDEKFQTAYDNWKQGKNADGVETPCFVPEGAPHEGLTPTPRPAPTA